MVTTKELESLKGIIHKPIRFGESFERGIWIQYLIDTETKYLWLPCLSQALNLWPTVTYTVAYTHEEREKMQ